MIERIRKKLARVMEVKTKTIIPGLDEFKTLADKADTRFRFDEADYYPCLTDDTPNTNFDRHYIYFPAWAVRIVKKINPEVHVDISSTLHFCSMLSAFMPVKFYDYRPAKLELDNLTSERADLLALDFPSDSIKSLSCMHTVEHVGLGRYGDKLDYDGDLKAVAELSRVLAPGGDLLFVTPVGSMARIQFNAHRIYTRQLITGMFGRHGLKLKEYTLIPEDEKDGGIVISPPEELECRQRYACGCFWFTK